MDLVGHSKDFAFTLNGMGGHWSILSRGMIHLDLLEQEEFGCCDETILQEPLPGDNLRGKLQ